MFKCFWTIFSLGAPEYWQNSCYFRLLERFYFKTYTRDDVLDRQSHGGVHIIQNSSLISLKHMDSNQFAAAGKSTDQAQLWYTFCT